jgi:hypothetical protein
MWRNIRVLQHTFPLMNVTLCIREDWLFYRGPSFLAVVWFGSMPPPPSSSLSRQRIFSLSQSSCVSPVKLIDGIGGVEGAGVDPNHATASLVLYKTFNTLCWASVNRSNLSARYIPRYLPPVMLKITSGILKNSQCCQYIATSLRIWRIMSRYYLIVWTKNGYSKQVYIFFIWQIWEVSDTRIHET